MKIKQSSELPSTEEYGNKNSVLDKARKKGGIDRA